MLKPSLMRPLAAMPSCRLDTKRAGRNTSQSTTSHRDARWMHSPRRVGAGDGVGGSGVVVVDSGDDVGVSGGPGDGMGKIQISHCRPIHPTSQIHCKAPFSTLQVPCPKQNPGHVVSLMLVGLGVAVG